MFDKQEVTREHVKTSHDPVDAWIERPMTGGATGMRTRDGSSRNPKKMPTITKV